MPRLHSHPASAASTPYKKNPFRLPLCLQPPLLPLCSLSHRCRVEGEHPTGACVDVGGEGQWDRLFVGWPVVVNHKELEFRMYYHSLDPDTKKFTVGE